MVSMADGACVTLVNVDPKKGNYNGAYLNAHSNINDTSLIEDGHKL